MNMDAMLQMLEDEDTVVEIPDPQIRRNRFTMQLTTDLTSVKKARLCFDKRVRLGYESLPFGVKEQSHVI